MVDAVEFHLGAGPLAIDHLVADLDAHRLQAAVLEALAAADRDDLALLGLFLGGIGNNDPGLGLGFGGDRLQQQPVMQGLEFHDISSVSGLAPLIGSGPVGCQRASLRSNCAVAAESSATRNRATSPSSSRLRTLPLR